MKKRVIAVLLAGMMVMGNTMVTMAAADTETEEAAEETTEETEETGETESSEPIVFDETKATFEGTWVPFEAGFKLYIPSEWSMMEISDEDAEKGLIFQAADEEKGFNVVVTETEVGEEYDNEKVKEELAGTYEGVSIETVNDLEVVGYSAKEQDSAGITILSEDGYMYAINCAPISDKDFAPMALDILSSLSIDDTDDAGEEADAEEADTEEAEEE